MSKVIGNLARELLRTLGTQLDKFTFGQVGLQCLANQKNGCVKSFIRFIGPEVRRDISTRNLGRGVVFRISKMTVIMGAVYLETMGRLE